MSEENNIIYVGKKPTMNYVLAVVTQFNSNNIEKIVIKARGKSISKAVDIAEITKNKFILTAKYADIHIETEKVEGERGESNVSSIEITLSK
ncbi:MAG: DNA-binding protein Alba [Cuniculiplasma sp.]